MLAFPSPEVLCTYLEPLVSGARVVLLGDSGSGAAERLAEAGARIVHVYDPDHLRVRAMGSRGRVVVAPLPAGDLDVRDGAFDVAFVPDLSAIPDPTAWLARLRRVLGPEGALLTCAPNPDAVGEGIAYYDLFDMVAMQFATVRMIAALPFRGTTLAEMGQEEEPEVTVETDLVGEPPAPLAFVALASQQDDVRLSPYAIVAQPAPSPEDDAEPPTLSPTDQFPPSEDLSAVEAELAEARLRADVLEGRIDEERTRVRDAGLQLSHLSRRNAELEAALVATAARASELESALVETAARASELESALGETGARASELEGALADTSERLDLALRAADDRGVQAPSALPARVAELERELEDAHRRIAVERGGQAERVERAWSEGEKHGLGTAETLAEEVNTLEQRLRERASAVAELQRELRRREKIVQDLLLMLEDAQRASATSTDAPEGDVLRPKLDALALELARRESDLEAARWRIAELEQRLARPVAPVATPAAPTSPRDVGGPPKEEVDVLRQALAQEHEARKRAESGEELSRAREELQRQAVLIEQLSQKLNPQGQPRR